MTPAERAALVGRYRVGYATLIAALDGNARAAIREVWLVDLAADQIEVYPEPEPDGYRQTRLLRRGESTVIDALPGLVVRVDDVLG